MGVRETLGFDSWNSIGIVNVYGGFGIWTEYTSSDKMVTSLWKQKVEGFGIFGYQIDK